MSNSVSSSGDGGGDRRPPVRSWSPSGFDHHERAEARGCVMTSLSDDRIIAPDTGTTWSPL